MESYNLVSLLGIFLLLIIAWATSKNRKNLNWNLIGFGLLFQMLLGALIFNVPAGSKFFLYMNDLVLEVITQASKGVAFLFGDLAAQPGSGKGVGFILAIHSLPTIIFFSALVSLLYYFGILQKVIQFFSFIFTKLFKVSGAESLCAASNIFVGIEASFSIKPYLEKLTKSEIVTVLTAGMATVATSVMGLYVYTLQGEFPTIAGHLMSASILSAPAALIMSKLIFPEDEKPATLGEHIKIQYERESSFLEAIINGAQNGVKVVVSIAALIIAVIGLAHLGDFLLLHLGNLINSIFNTDLSLSISGILGKVFYPLTLIIGIPVDDAGAISKIIGERILFTEVVSYQNLATLLKEGTLKHGRSTVIATYALCGFAHFASVAIFSGGLSALIPSRKRDIAKVSFRALWAATLACLMTAAIAGTFYNAGSTIL